MDVLDVSGLGGDVPEGVGLVSDVDGLEGVVSLVRSYRGVVDHPGLHPNVVERGRLLTGLAAAGVPLVVSDLSRGLEQVLGEALAGVLRSVSLDDVLGDVHRRERVSVRIRREALRSVSLRSRWTSMMEAAGLPVRPLPTVSVVMSTNRPDFVDHALGQVGKQTYPRWELILVLHGDGFSVDVDGKARNVLGDRVRVVRADGRWTLGDALNVGVDAASGTLITKMDDDDWYGADHLWDLVLALEYSRADLVGKAAEFVYLAGLDVTIRRFQKGAETASPTLAGGTLMTRRATIDSLGGWRRVSVGEDRDMIGAVVSTGGTVHRTHGLGYILHRHGNQAWSASDQMFIDQGTSQRDGLARTWAAI